MRKLDNRRRVRSGRHFSRVAGPLVVVLFSGCGDDRVWPDVRGTYDGDWTLTGNNRDTGIQDTVGCSGAVSIAEQRGSRFSGTFTIESAGYCAGRDDLVGRVEDGRLLEDLALRFELESDEDGGQIWRALTDCEAGTRSNRLEGRLTGDSLTAAVSGVISCENLGTIDVSLRVDARRATGTEDPSDMATSPAREGSDTQESSEPQP